MRARATLLLCIAAALPGMSSAAEHVAPAEGSVALRFATVTATLTPARVRPGGEGVLRISLVPAEGLSWHDAPFVPSRVDVYPPAGWEAKPSEPELPMPEESEDTRAERAFAVRVTAGPSAEARRKLDLEIRYGVRDAANPARAKVYFEDVRLEVELPPPELDPAVEVGALGGSRKSGILSLKVTPRARPEPDSGGGSPVLPTIFFAAASLLVLAGLAMAIKRARRGSHRRA